MAAGILRAMHRWHLLEDLDETEQLGAKLIGTVVRRSRLWAGLTQRQLGWRAGISQSVISRLETGRLRGMRYRTLVRVVGATEAPVHAARGDEPPAPRRRLPGQPPGPQSRHSSEPTEGA